MKDLGNKTVMAKNLRRYMAQSNVNAKDLSKSLNFPYTTVLSWLKAENYPRIDKIEAMAEYFGILKSDLIEEQIEKPTTENGSGLHETGYDQLSPENKSVIDSLIEKLLKSQSGE